MAIGSPAATSSKTSLPEVNVCAEPARAYSSFAVFTKPAAEAKHSRQFVLPHPQGRRSSDWTGEWPISPALP